jgi:hypothetical protein
MPPRDSASPLREPERDGRRRYQAAVAAARESLRNAEEHFRAASDAIDTHIQAALAAMAGRGNLYRARVGEYREVPVVAEASHREDAEPHPALECVARARFAPRGNRTAAEGWGAQLSPMTQQ